MKPKFYFYDNNYNTDAFDYRVDFPTSRESKYVLRIILHAISEIFNIILNK